MEADLEDLEFVIDFPNQPRLAIGNNYEVPANLQVGGSGRKLGEGKLTDLFSTFR